MLGFKRSVFNPTYRSFNIFLYPVHPAAGLVTLFQEFPISPIQYLPTPYSYSSALKAGDFVFLGLHRGAGDNFPARMTATTQFIDADCLLMIDGTACARG